MARAERITSFEKLSICLGKRCRLFTEITREAYTYDDYSDPNFSNADNDSLKFVLLQNKIDNLQLAMNNFEQQVQLILVKTNYTNTVMRIRDLYLYDFMNQKFYIP